MEGGSGTVSLNMALVATGEACHGQRSESLAARHFVSGSGDNTGPVCVFRDAHCDSFEQGEDGFHNGIDLIWFDLETTSSTCRPIIRAERSPGMPY